MTIGQGYTQGISSVNNRRDLSDAIRYVQGDDVSYFVKLAKMIQKSKPATDSKVEWQEKSQNLHSDHAGNAVSSSGTTLVLAKLYKYLQYNNSTTSSDLLKNVRTGEIVKVNATPTTSSVTIERGRHGTTAAAIKVGDQFVRVGRNIKEGRSSDDVDAISYEPTQVYNYCEEFETKVGSTERIEATQYHFGKGRIAMDKSEAYISHMSQLEYALFFGSRAATQVSGYQYVYKTGGIKYFIDNSSDAVAQGNIIDYNNVIVSESEFMQDLLTKVFKYGSKNKALFCGANIITAVNSWAKDKVVVNQEAKKWGMDINTLIIPGGCSLDLIYHKNVFDGNAAYKGNLSSWGFVVDMKKVMLRPFTKVGLLSYETGVQANGATTIEDRYRSILGLELHNPECHCYFKNFAY